VGVFGSTVPGSAAGSEAILRAFFDVGAALYILWKDLIRPRRTFFASWPSRPASLLRSTRLAATYGDLPWLFCRGIDH